MLKHKDQGTVNKYGYEIVNGVLDRKTREENFDLLHEVFLQHKRSVLSSEQIQEIREHSNYFNYLLELLDFTLASGDGNEASITRHLGRLSTEFSLPLPYFGPILDQIVTIMKVHSVYLPAETRDQLIQVGSRLHYDWQYDLVTLLTY